MFESSVHQDGGASVVQGADGKNVFETQRGKFHGVVGGGLVVGFVNGEQRGFAALAQMLGHFLVQRHNAFLHIDDKNNRIRRLNGQIHLFHRGRGDDVLRFLARNKADSAGIHERKRPSCPFGLGCDAVARHPCLIVHNGNAAAGNPVK